MSAKAATTAPTGRKKAIGQRPSATGQSGSGVPPLNQEREQKRDASATLGHHPQNTPAPTGRKTIAQGNALGNPPPNTPSPEGAKEASSKWKRVRVGNTLRLVNGSAFKPTDWTKDGLPIVRIQNLNNPDAPFNRTTRELPEKFKLRGGELLFAWSGTPGTSFGAHIWRGAEAWLNQHIFNVLFDENEWDKKFLQFAINQNLADYIRAAHGGAGLAHITKGRFEESELLRPTPAEQRRIVAEIEKQFTRLEAGVAALRRVQTNLKRYRAAVLKAACEGDWPQEPLGEIAEVRLGKMLDKAKHVSGRKLPYLRNVNVRWGKTDTDDLREMYFKDDELERYTLKAGDVLVCEGGEPGRAAVWSGHLPEMKYQKAIHRVRFNIPFEPRLLVWLLERLALTGGLERRFTGSTIKHFTREAFIALPVPLPPLAEQTRIVAEVERRLSVVEELEALVSANLLRASRLRQSILQKAFTGNL